MIDNGDSGMSMSKYKKRILIIDDEAVFREALTRALMSCGFEGISENNPSNGIMRLKKESFDLLLLDIMMDPFDGWDTLAHIRSLSTGVDIPVIMASAKNLDVNEIIRYGEFVAGFVSKPFVDSEFCEAISDFFSWYDPLIKNAKAAQLQGVPLDMCNRWIRLTRQIKAINQMMEVVSPRCIPNESSTEEECMTQRRSQIHLMIRDKNKERDELRILYPVFSL